MYACSMGVCVCVCVCVCMCVLACMQVCLHARFHAHVHLKCACACCPFILVCPMIIRAQALKTRARSLSHTHTQSLRFTQDFDPFLNTSVAWMKKSTQSTPMLMIGSGCISRSQFLRGMSRITARMSLTEDELNLIFNKYKKNGAFNYFAFCKDVDPGFDELRAMFAPGNHV